MLTGTFFAGLRWRLETLRAAEEGNVATIFALALIPVTLLTGTGIDYTNGSAATVAMQAALDSTALALAQSASSLSRVMPWVVTSPK